MNCLAQRKRFKNKHAAWTDPSETDRPVQEHTVHEQDDGTTSSSETDDDGSEEMIAGDIRSKKISLQANQLKYKHVVDVNNERSFNGSVGGVEFHPNSKIALVTLLKNQADLFEVDGERNRHLQNIKLPYSKKPFCAFKPDGDHIVISSENYRGNFYSYDMIGGVIKKFSLTVGNEPKEITDFMMHDDYMACRREGSTEVIVISNKTFETAFTLKLNEPAQAIQFTNRHEILVATENSKVYIWDLRKTSLCKHRFQDEGSVHTTSFALSEKANSLSLGSDCGVVNTFNLENCYESKFPTPVKTFTNLKGAVDLLKYNHSGEILLMNSSKQFEGFRLAHTPSGFVYKNFPLGAKRYGKLNGADFSPQDGYLALGCSSGRAHLCRISYYKSY